MILLGAMMLAAGSRPGPTFLVSADVHGLDTQRGGTLFISLLDETGRTIQSKRSAVDEAKVRIDFEPVSAGRYAIRAYQDVNGNGKLDLGWFRIPREPTGASNDARGFMSAPRLVDMLFRVSAPVRIDINMVQH